MKERGDMRLRADIAAHLRVARQLSGLSQREVALRMGTTKSVVTLLENTSNWTVKTFLRWTHALGLRPTYTLKGLPPLDVSQPLVAAALERPSTHPLGNEALAVFLLDKHINQIRTMQGLPTIKLRKDAMVSDIQREVRTLGGVLRISLSRNDG